ncbi:DUF4143 domain-containing protein [[Mycoplasma] testudinis]|uniref:DUF4143 domain-containing protein n=1 Tax=[Mycoplasma] testudinis TaxID=33924 RepID=UPI00069626C7|nr:DUF4143 domain-containing protein [[Mycoplasma] testudinis]
MNENIIPISIKTIFNYLNFLCDAFVFYRFKRYYIKGKRYLKTVNKFYLVDHAIRMSKLSNLNLSYGKIYENIVAIELLRHGYDVYIGKINDKEIDFIATKNNEKFYIQVAATIEEDSTFKREITPLLQIKDAYSKIIIARTKLPEYDYERIKIINLTDWLLSC